VAAAGRFLLAVVSGRLLDSREDAKAQRGCAVISGLGGFVRAGPGETVYTGARFYFL